MIKQITKRWLAFSLVLVMLVGFMPATAYAAGVNTGVTGLTAESSGDATWIYSNGTITGSATTTSEENCMGGRDYTPISGSLTLKNTSDSAALLSFDYVLEANGGSASLDSTDVTASSSFNRKLDSNGTVQISITSSDKSDTTITFKISNLKLTPEENVTMAFIPPAANGTYTVDGQEVTAETVKTKLNTENFILEATPASGYQFLRWTVQRGNSISALSNSKKITTTFTENGTVTAEFVQAGLAIYGVGKDAFTDLNEAIDYATTKNESTIVLLSDATLPAGNYTIPSGKTLLIPFDEARTVVKDTPEVVYGSHSNPTAFRTLTMDPGANLIIDGELSLGGKLCSTGQLGGWNGTPTGADGRINMESGSKITVNGNGKLYCWGYIYGSGAVEARAGATVHEAFQIKDWRGGSATSSVYSYAFILNQYYVQNIEVPLTLNAGAREILYSAANASNTAYPMGVTFIGSTEGMFRLNSGYLVKDYIESTDRLQVDVYGNTTISPMSMSGLPLIGSIDTSGYILPITSNITINLHSNTTTLVEQNLELLPSVEINIDDGANLTIATGKKVYVYDNEDWGNFTGSAKLYVIGYSVANGTTAKRNAAGLTDAIIKVDGTVTVDGSVYTSQHGAGIISSDNTSGGKVVFKTATSQDSTIYECDNNKTKTAVTFTPAKLKNAVGYDPEYTESAGKPAGATATYVTDHWSWGAKTITYNANVTGQTIADVTQSTEDDQVTLMSFEDEAFAAFVYEGHTFKGWNTKADGTGTSYEDAQADVEITEDLTLYAQWEEAASYTVTWKNGDTVLETDENVLYNDHPVFDGEMPVKEGDAQYSYTFAGWVKNDGTEVVNLTNETVTEDVTYTAKFTQTVNKYTVTWKNEDGSTLETDENVEYGTVPTFDGNEPVKEGDAQYGYIFRGWSTEDNVQYLDGQSVPEVTGDVTYTAVYQEYTKQYTVTWIVNGVTAETDEGVEYGAQPVYDGETPAKAETEEYTYTFAGWEDDNNVTYAADAQLPQVTGDVTYTAVFTETAKTRITYNANYSFDGEEPEEVVQYTADEVVKLWSNEEIGFFREGWTFTGWNTEPNGSGTTYLDGQENVTLTGDLTLYAQWAEEPYVLTLDPDAEPFGYAEGKNERDAVITVTDETVTIPENIYTREGYVFKGWSTVSSNVEDDGQTYQPGQTVARDALFSNGRERTLYATWNRSYTVTWKDWDGTVLETDENVLYNDHPVFDGETPVKAEDDDNFYTFDGWVIEGTEDVVDLETERVTEDVTYTAHFAAEAKIAITFAPGTPEGATVTGTMPVQKIRSGVETALNANAFQIEGYSFQHWTDGTGNYADGAAVNFTANTTLTAVWEKNRYTVTLHHNYESTTPVEEDVNPVTHGESFQIPANAFTHDGYTLIGWSEEPAATTPTYDVTGTIPNVTRDYDLYAVWQIKTYTITLKANYEGGADPAALTVGHNETVTLPELTREGYGFNGWNTKADGTGIGYDVGDAGFTEDTTLYAQWTPNKYKITFKNGNETLETYQVAYGMMPVYDGAEPIKEGDAQYSYTFAGWEPALTAVTGDAIYTATFTQSTNKYTVTFYNEDGTTVLQQNQVEYGTAPSYSGTEPAKPETAQYTYSFAGWKAEDGTEYPVGQALPQVTGTVAYTAYYTETVKKYTVKFFNEDGEVLQTGQVAYGETPAYTGQTPEKAADAQYTYTFKGWSLDGETTVEPGSVTVNGELNFTALYDKTLNTYTVTWKNGNDVLETDENVPYGTTPEYSGETPVKDPTAAETYTFSGWKDQNGADYSADTSIVQGNTTYTAQFAAETRKYTITFVNEDGEVLQTGQVAYGETPAYTGATPEKDADAQYTYTWTGAWNKEIVPVADDATYTATYTGTLRSYTVTWVNGDTVLETDADVEYGTVPSYDGAEPTKESTVSETFSFSGWTPEISEVTGDVTYTAKFESAPRMYTVRFMNGDTLLQSGEVAYGSAPEYTGETPTKDADTQFTYEFAGWTKDGEPVELAAESVSGDATYQARFDAIDIFYTVTWCNWNGVELYKVENYKYGNTIELPDTVVPEHSNENPAKYSYTFDGWIVNGDENNVVKEFGSVTGNVTYTAKFTESINTYTITFKDADGTVLQSSSVAYDETPVYNGNDPSKPGDVQYSYTFKGWDPALTAVTGDATYTATYQQTVNKYLIQFVNEDGAVLQSSEVEYGTTPAYTGETPTKASTAQYSYTFAGWDNEIVPVTGIATYTATYTSAVRSYTVTWKNEDGNVLETDTVPYGTVPTYDGATPTKEGNEEFSYVFAGWDYPVSEVTGDATYTATFTEETNSYKVTWNNWDGSTLETDTEVPYGAQPTYDSAIPEKAADAQYTYTFTGWTPAVSAVTGNVTYTASYSTTVNTYTVTWVNADGTVLETDTEVPYGAQPTYDSADPAKAADAQYTYTFSGWTPTVSEVQGDVTYTASYSTTVNTYTVTWIVDGETVETDVNVPYGTVPEYNGDAPAKASDAQYDYSFTGWDGDTNVGITGDVTFNAVFEGTLRQYTVRWVNDVKDENGEYIVLETDLYVPYDTHPSFDSETLPTKAPDVQFTYSFSGEWVVVGQEDVKYDENYKVSGDVTFRAVYSTTVNTYTVTWNNWDGTLLETDADVAYGTTPEYNGADPAREGDAQYSYTWTGGWDQTIAPVTGNVTYTAVFEQTVNTYNVTWLNEDGSVITTDTVAYGDTPAYTGDPLTKAETLTHSYTFSGWTPEIAAVNGEAEYTAVFAENAKNGWIRWTDNGIYYIDNGTVVTGAARVAYPEDSSFGYAEPAWNDAYDSGHPTDGKGTFLFGEDGKLQTEVNGFCECSALNSSYPTEWLTVPATVWAINGEIVWHPGLVTDGSDYYYFKTDNSMVKDRDYTVTKVNDQFYTDEDGAHNFVSGSKYSFDADGRIKLLNGFVDDGNVTYYYVYGAKTYAGLVRIGEDYYYVKSDCTVVKGRSYYVGKTNGMLPAGVYSFDADGKLVMDTKNGIARDENGVLRYYVDGAVQKGTGVVKVGDNYYYVNGSGVVISGRDYAITKTNNLSYTKADGSTAVFEYQKTYSFDENGVMLLNDGFVDADGQTYYYQNGIKTYGGLIKVGEDYYYVKSNCTVVKNCKYYVSKTNGLMAAGSYQFDAEGKMIVPNDGGFTGFKKDDEGVLRYYVKDVMQQNLGLILVDGSYYYINGSGVVASNCDYAVSNTNNLSFTKADGTVVPFASGKIYTFDANGVLQLFDGITDVGGKKIYYVNGVKTYAGLIQIGEDFYYVKSSCELVVNGSYYVSKTNGLKPAGRYSFDADGKLI